MLARFWRVVGAQLLAIARPRRCWHHRHRPPVRDLQVRRLAVRPAGDPLRATSRSARPSAAAPSLVRGRWWHTVRVAGFFWLLSIAAGPVLGFALIFTDFALVWINLIGSLVFALLIPYVTSGRTLLYFDLQVRAEDVRPRSRAGLRAALAGPKKPTTPQPCRKAEGEGGDRRRQDQVDEQGAPGAGTGGDSPRAHCPPFASLPSFT